METSLNVYDYPTQPEVETETKDIVVYVKLTFKNVELEKDYSIVDYIHDNGIDDYDEFEIEDIEEN